MLRVETQVGAEQQILFHSESAHQDIILETQASCKQKPLRIILNMKCQLVHAYVFVFVYLNHIGRAEPEFRRDNPAIHQNISCAQSSRVFSSCNYIEESEKAERS